MEEASLRHCRLFAGLGEDILNECCSRFAAVRVESGDSVALQGATCSRFLIVVRGLLQLRRLTAEGREFTVRISRPGDFLGDEGMLGYAEYAVSAVALIDSVVAFCPSGYARELLVRQPQLALNYARCVREYHDCDVAKYEEASSNRVRHRLLRLLREFATECGVLEPGGTTIDLPLTHDLLGSLIGAQRETVTAALTALTRSGEIARRGRRIVLPLRSGQAA